MHSEWYGIRHRERIREAEEYRLVRQARRGGSAPRAMTAGASRPASLRRLAAWLRE